MSQQRRKLVLCLREAPLNLIHLRNTAAVTETGATVHPMIPTYCNVPETLAQLRDEFVVRVVQFMDLPAAQVAAGGTAATPRRDARPEIRRRPPLPAPR
ncbi:flavoprotein [Streptomyces sp. NPDC056352]|uniref:flavoprotein n=1 Tax=Streptomyces sp. NPDC056352 TaxID=3345791 RepID=UPI0035DB199B